MVTTQNHFWLFGSFSVKFAIIRSNDLPENFRRQKLLLRLNIAVLAAFIEALACHRAPVLALGGKLACRKHEWLQLLWDCAKG